MLSTLLQCCIVIAMQIKLTVVVVASTLSEFIGYADSTDFREISPEQSRDNNKPKRVGKFWYLTYFSRGFDLRNTSRTFLAAPILDVDI